MGGFRDRLRKFFGRKVFNATIERTIASNYTCRDYETFVLSQPQIKVSGLYLKAGNYHIVCPDLKEDTLALDGSLIQTWFSNHKVLGSRTFLVTSVPEGANKVDSLTPLEEANLYSAVRRLTDLYYDLLMYLPKNFPSFKLQDRNTGRVFMITDIELTEEQKQIFKTCLTSLNEKNLSIVFEVKNLAEIELNIIDEPILLQPSKSAKNILDPKIKLIQEEDEDFWVTNKTKLLNNSIKKETFLPAGWNNNGSKCLVSDYVQPDNIRNHLTLYDSVLLRMPINNHHEQYFYNLGCSEKELIGLSNMGRVKLIFDQPMHRYSPKTHDILQEIQESSFIQSRRLATLNVADLRTRVPFAFPIFDIDTKHELLQDIYRILGDGTSDKALSQAVVGFLGVMWGNYFEGIERLGAKGLQDFGTYHFTNYIFEHSFARDLSVEIMDTEPGVNYAASLGANLITRKMINDDAIASLIANIYSGVPKNFIPGKQYESNLALNEILLVNSDVPIEELARTFQSNDINKLRSLIYCLTRHSKNEEELLTSVASFNEEVKHFVNKKEQTNKLDITGFLLDAGTSALNTTIPFLGWFSTHAIKGLSAMGAKRKTIRTMSDYLSSQLTGTYPDAVLVARMRKDLLKSEEKTKYNY